MVRSVNSSWRILGAVMIAVTSAATLYGLAGVLTSKDPLAIILVPLVIVPSAIPLVLGVFMWRGHRWALIGLRTSIILVLAIGIFMTLVVRLDVFSFYPFVIPFITFCIAWLLFSFKCKST